jgi:hypothetical protein
MNKTKHIAQFESFREDSRIGTPNTNAGFSEGTNDYTKGVICIGDYGGGGLAVGTVNSAQDAAYIQELEEYQGQEIGIDVFGNYGDQGSFVSFSDEQFTLHESGETYKAKEDSFVFTITNGSFLVLTDGYAQYELLTAKEVRDWFAR